MKWTEDEDEDGSSAKNLRRMKIFKASLEHWISIDSNLIPTLYMDIFKKEFALLILVGQYSISYIMVPKTTIMYHYFTLLLKNSVKIANM